jgi:hypothetical protein
LLSVIAEGLEAGENAFRSETFFGVRLMPARSA